MFTDKLTSPPAIVRDVAAETDVVGRLADVFLSAASDDERERRIDAIRSDYMGDMSFIDLLATATSVAGREVEIAGCDLPKPVKASLRVLNEKGEEAPRPWQIRIVSLSEQKCAACAGDGLVWIDPGSRYFRHAEAGDPFPLSMILRHEYFHLKNGREEGPAYADSLRYLRLNDSPAWLIEDVEKSRDAAIAREMAER